MLLSSSYVSLPSFSFPCHGLLASRLLPSSGRLWPRCSSSATRARSPMQPCNCKSSRVMLITMMTVLLLPLTMTMMVIMMIVWLRFALKITLSFVCMRANHVGETRRAARRNVSACVCVCVPRFETLMVCRNESSANKRAEARRTNASRKTHTHTYTRTCTGPQRLLLLFASLFPSFVCLVFSPLFFQ